MRLQFICICIASIIFGVLGDAQFKSRPDLAPPKIHVVYQTEHLSDGYLFLTPRAPLTKSGRQTHEAQSAAYIFTPSGELVWSGYTFFGTPAFNFQVSKYNGENVIYAFQGSFNPDYGHGHGWIRILNDKYQLVKEVRAGRNKLSDLHEFQITKEGTGLLEIYQPTRRNLSAAGAISSKHEWVVDAQFQEIDIESGSVLFEWSSLDHVPFEESVLPLGLRGKEQGLSSSTAWDYFHINSVDKLVDGNYLISARHTNTIYKINSTDGSIIWRLGGNYSDFPLDDDSSFAFQHHARYRGTDHKGRTLLSLFDNHSARPGQDHALLEVPSSGKLFALDEINHEASLLVQYSALQPIVSQSQGNLQILENGNAVIGWGQIPAITEFLHNGTVVYHAEVHFDGEQSQTESYRNFKFAWNGQSSEDIAVVEEHGVVYVSWNGDTTVKEWALLVREKGRWVEVKRANRTGFETAIEVGGGYEIAVVEGIDRTGESVGRSRDILSSKKSQNRNKFVFQNP